MSVKSFSIKEAVRFGWETFKNNVGFFIGIIMIVGIVNFVPGFFAEAVKKQNPILALIINLASSVLAMIIEMGIIKIVLKFCDYEKPDFNDLFSCVPLFFKFAVAALLYGLIIFAGFILLIVPGIIWGIQFGFAKYAIIDKNFGPIVALKKSSVITKGEKWDLFKFSLLLIGLNILGILCLLIGLFVTIPVSSVAAAFVYRKLLSRGEPVPAV